MSWPRQQHLANNPNQLTYRRHGRQLTADDVDKWLSGKAKELSTRTLRLIHSLLSRAVVHAQARDNVKRNVVALCDIPTGRSGRPSKSLTFAEAEAVLDASERYSIHAYIVLSILISARTGELRALTWSHVDLEGKPEANPPVLPSISVWHSVRVGGDTKTPKSKRTLAMPIRCVTALRAHHHLQQQAARRTAGKRWQENDLAYASEVGTELDSHNVRRAFRKVVATAQLPADDWTPRELRHSFVSLLSDSGVKLEDIARPVGHSGTAVTEAVYRHQIRPVMQEGATAMDDLFPGTGSAA